MLMKRAKVREWVNAIQLVCPYCNAVQTESTAVHVIHSPPKFWICEKCKRRMLVGAGLGLRKVVRRIFKGRDKSV